MKTTSNRQTEIQRRGLTLLEVTISTLLIGMLIVACLRVTGGALRTWYGVRTQYDRQMLASQLMDEILQTSYEDPDGSPDFGVEVDEEGPLNRSLFDDIDDYDDWAESKPHLKDGTVLSGYTGWRRSVNVVLLKSNDYQTTIIYHNQDEGLRKITVTVTDPHGNITNVTAFRTTEGASQRSRGNDGTYITWLGCELQLGAEGEKITNGACVLNHATDRSL